MLVPPSSETRVSASWGRITAVPLPRRRPIRVRVSGAFRRNRLAAAAAFAPEPPRIGLLRHHLVRPAHQRQDLGSRWRGGRGAEAGTRALIVLRPRFRPGCCRSTTTTVATSPRRRRLPSARVYSTRFSNSALRYACLIVRSRISPRSIRTAPPEGPATSAEPRPPTWSERHPVAPQVVLRDLDRDLVGRRAHDAGRRPPATPTRGRPGYPSAPS